MGKNEDSKIAVEIRVNRILENLDSLQTLASSPRFEYSNQQVERIFNAIDSKLDSVKDDFSKRHLLKQGFKL